VLVVEHVDGFDDGVAGCEWVGAKEEVVDDAGAAEKKKGNVTGVVVDVVSPIPGTVVNDIVAVAAAGVIDNVGVPMCCWIAGGMSTEVTTRALGLCSLTRIYCCYLRQGHLRFQRK
jgi:hypothetical protein